MTHRSPFSAQIVGTGTYLPEKILTNKDLEKTLETSDEWIRARTGIEERRIAAKDESSSTMAVKASLQAMKEADVAAGQLDMIIVCTSTPDILYPSTGCFVQKGLGAVNAAAYDISAVCSGFIYGLSIAEQYLKSGRLETILVVGSEVNSRIMDWEDRSTCILFGDGAGAAILKRTETQSPKGILSTHIHSDGSKAEMLCVPGGIGRERISSLAAEQKQYTLKMAGGATFKSAVKRMTEAAIEALEFNGLVKEDVSLMVPHQANKRIIDAVAKHLDLPLEKTFVNINRYGNTAGAAIPIALHESREEGRVKDGDLVLITGLGAGLTWGSALIRW